MNSKLGHLDNVDKMAVYEKKIMDQIQALEDLTKLNGLYKSRIRELEGQVKFHTEKTALVEKILNTVFPDWKDEKAWAMLDEAPAPLPDDEMPPLEPTVVASQ